MKIKTNWFEKLYNDGILPSPDHSGILFCYLTKAWPQKRYSGELYEAPESLIMAI